MPPCSSLRQVSLSASLELSRQRVDGSRQLLQQAVLQNLHPLGIHFQADRFSLRLKVIHQKRRCRGSRKSQAHSSVRQLDSYELSCPSKKAMSFLGLFFAHLCSGSVCCFGALTGSRSFTPRS